MEERELKGERKRMREAEGGRIKLNTFLVLPVLPTFSISVARPISLGREGLSVNPSTC